MAADIKAMFDASFLAVCATVEAKAGLETAKETAFDCHKAFVVYFRDEKGHNTKESIKEQFRVLCQKNATAETGLWPKDENGKFRGYQKAIDAGCKNAVLYNAFAKHCDTKLNNDGTYISAEQKKEQKEKERREQQHAAELKKQQQSAMEQEKLLNAAEHVELDAILTVLKEKHGATIEETENGFITISIVRPTL